MLGKRLGVVSLVKSLGSSSKRMSLPLFLHVVQMSVVDLTHVLDDPPGLVRVGPHLGEGSVQRIPTLHCWLVPGADSGLLLRVLLNKGTLLGYRMFKKQTSENIFLVRKALVT